MEKRTDRHALPVSFASSVVDHAVNNRWLAENDTPSIGPEILVQLVPVHNMFCTVNQNLLLSNSGCGMSWDTNSVSLPEPFASSGLDAEMRIRAWPLQLEGARALFVNVSKTAWTRACKTTCQEVQ